MATEPEALPPKLKLSSHIDRSKGETYKDLPVAERKIYDDYWTAYHRRKDPSQPGVAQEALACVAWLKQEGRSESEADNLFGYSAARTCKPAKREEDRIVRELGEKPAKDVSSSMLVVLDVMVAKGIPEFVPKAGAPEPIPE